MEARLAVIQVDKLHHEPHSRRGMVLEYEWRLNCCFSRHTKFREGQHCHSEKAVVIAAVVQCPAGFAVALGDCIAGNTPVGPSGVALLSTPSEICVLLNRKGP